MQTKISIFTSLFFLLVSAGPVKAEPIHIYTEEFPPFNYTENGKLTGISTEVIEAVMKQAKLEYVIESLPWARAYQKAQDEQNSFIYSIGRQPKREKLFKWIGIIAPSTQSVFRLKSRTDIKISNLNDMKKYRIGTTIGDARETYLLGKGIPVDESDRLGGDDSYYRNYIKLKSNKIDLWPLPEAVAYHIVKKAGDNPDKTIRKVFELTDISGEGYYVAASLKTSDELIAKVTKTLEAFKKTSQYRDILKKWGIRQ